MPSNTRLAKQLLSQIVLWFAVAFCAPAAFGQTTLVTGTVKDVNGVPYAGGTIKAQLVLAGSGVTGTPTVTVVGVQACASSGFGSSPCQVPFSGTDGPVNLDSTGSFSMALQSNNIVTPSGTQWLFSVTSQGAPPPLGTGPQACTATITITGASQSISTSFSGCPALGNGIGGGAFLATGFNVVTFGGAVGDAQESNNFTLSGSTTQTCTDCGFVAARDTGKEIACGLNAATQLAATTITNVVNATTITTAGTALSSGPAVCGWGTSHTVNDAAFAKTQTAFLAQIHARISDGVLGGPYTGAPVFYVPSGAYLLCNFGWNIFSPSGGASGDLVTGDTQDASTIIYESGCNAGGSAQALFAIQGSVQTNRVEHLRFDGMRGAQNGTTFNTVFLIAGTTYMNWVTIQRFGIGTGISTNAALYSHDGLFIVANGGVGISIQSGGGGSIDNGGSSNNTVNLVIQNVVGENTGAGFRVGKGWLNDECGGPACVQLINAQDVWFEGSAMYGAPTCVSVDQTSFLHWVGGICGVFGNDTNSQGLSVALGGQVQSSDVRYISSGTAKCITNNGSFYDNGGNSCESQFPIVSGTSTGTAAVLTVTPSSSNVNVNCSIGDTLIVEGAGPVGYNGYFPFGITAVGTNTISYTTVGSNLGAASAVGAAYCRNLQTYSGNLPKALLNNPIPNTCYVTGAFAATVTGAPMCNFRAQSPTNITRITASSTTVTACATAPVVTISDGTVSWTLTLTTGKSQWDSAVDTSTGVNTTIAKPNGTIQVTNTAGTCATPPTNFSVSYNIAPVLSN